MNNRKEPWEAYPDVWPTKASFFSWLRGGLRRALWEKLKSTGMAYEIFELLPNSFQEGQEFYKEWKWANE